MSTTFKSRALVLSSSSRGEKDRLVDFFTEEKGRLAVVAYGARKPGSRFGALLEPGMLVSGIFRRGRFGFPSLVECSLERAFPAGLTTLEEMETIQELLRLVRSGIREEAPDRFFFEEALVLLELFLGRRLPLGLLRVLVRLALLRHFGIQPEWSGCGGCGCVKPRMRVNRHGLFCDVCGDGERALVRFTGGDVRILSLLSTGDMARLAALRIQEEQRLRLEQGLDVLIRYSRQGT